MHVDLKWSLNIVSATKLKSATSSDEFSFVVGAHLTVHTSVGRWLLLCCLLLVHTAQCASLSVCDRCFAGTFCAVALHRAVKIVFFADLNWKRNQDTSII